jgi:hypothetical protein
MSFPVTKTIKDAIRADIGQSVTFVMEGTEVPCSSCLVSGYYDSVNNVSLDQFCPTCSGNYWITNDSNAIIVSHVRWITGEQSDFGIAGDIKQGDCIVTVDIDSLSEEQIANVKHVLIDDKKLEIFRTIKRGVPERDRYRFTLREV